MSAPKRRRTRRPTATRCFSYAAECGQRVALSELNFVFLRDITPVASIMRTHIMEVNASLPVKTVVEFIAYAKPNPGAQHGVVGRRHRLARRRRAVQDHDRRRPHPRAVSRPGAGITDLLGGRVQVMFDVLTSSIARSRRGAPPRRHHGGTLAALPDVPALDEFGAGYEFERRPALARPPTRRPTSSAIQRRDRRRARRARRPQASRIRRASRSIVVGRVRQIPHRRDREVGQGGEVRQHQAGLMRLLCNLLPTTMIRRREAKRASKDTAEAPRLSPFEGRFAATSG